MCSFLYELDAHLDRLLRSAAKSKITSPFDRATLRHILIQTVAASKCKRGSLRYWLSAGLGGFGLSSKECFKSTFYAMVTDVTYKGPEGVKVRQCPVPDLFTETYAATGFFLFLDLYLAFYKNAQMDKYQSSLHRMVSSWPNMYHSFNISHDLM